MFKYFNVTFNVNIQIFKLMLFPKLMFQCDRVIVKYKVQKYKI